MVSRLSPALRAYLLLTLTTLMWGGNVVAGRLAVGEVSPMVLVTLRWVIVCAVLVLVARQDLRRDVRAIRAHWPRIALMGTLGYTAFNALFYVAAHYTVAANIAILQGAIPVLVLIGAALLFSLKIGFWQGIGVVLTLLGVVLVATRGHPEVLSNFALNRGDAAMLLACLFYAAYTLALRTKPDMSSLSLFVVMSMAALATSLPLLIGEMAMGLAQWPTGQGWWITLYVGIFPSLLAQLFFIWSVDLIGPARAGIFTNLVPVFGPLLGILILAEPILWFHATGLILVLGGIFLAEKFRR